MSGSDIMTLFRANSDSVEISIAALVFLCCLCFCCTALLFVIRMHFQRRRAKYRRVRHRESRLCDPETLKTTTSALPEFADTAGAAMKSKQSLARPPRDGIYERNGINGIYGNRLGDGSNRYLLPFGPFQTNTVHPLSTRSAPDHFSYCNGPINFETNMMPFSSGHCTGIIGHHPRGLSPSLQQSLHQTSTALSRRGKIFEFPVPAPIEVDGSVFGATTVPLRTFPVGAEIATSEHDSNLSDVSESSNQIRECSLNGNRSESMNGDGDSCGDSECNKRHKDSQQMVSRTRSVHLEDEHYID